MLTELEKVAFGIYKFLLSYVPRFVLDFTPGYENLYVSKSKLRWVWFGFGLLNSFLIGSANLYVFLSVILGWKKGVKLTQLFLIVGGTAFLIVMYMGLGLFIQLRHDALKGINSMFQITEKMMRRFRPEAFNTKGIYDNQGKMDIQGNCACILSFSLTSSPVWLSFAVVFAEFDTLADVANDVLPDAKHRTTTVIILIDLARFLILLISMTEIIKILTMFVLLLITSIRNMMELLHHFLHGMKGDTELFLKYYLRIVATTKLLDCILGDLFLIILTAAFWGTVISTWLAVVGYGKMELYIYGFLIGGLVITYGIGAFFIRKFKAAIAMTEEIIAKRNLEAKECYVVRKTRKAKWIMKRVKALTPIQFKYGSFFALSQPFFVEYLEAMMGRIIDAVLLFDLKNVA